MTQTDFAKVLVRPEAHSRIVHHFFSYLLTCEVDLFEVLDFMAQMWHYINFFSYKPTKVTSDFILNYLKKVIGGATTQKNLKTNPKTLISSIPKGFTKDAPGFTKHAIWGLVC